MGSKPAGRACALNRAERAKARRSVLLLDSYSRAQGRTGESGKQIVGEALMRACERQASDDVQEGDGAICGEGCLRRYRHEELRPNDLSE